jgi:hypothetical protein
MNLSQFYAPSWNTANPLSGSGRRALDLAPGIPPRPIHNACVAAGIQWNNWLTALAPVINTFEFTFFVNPGSISVRNATGNTTTVWAPAVPSASVKTAGQRAIEDMDADEIFAMVDLVTAEDSATWLGATLNAFPGVPGFPARRAVSPTGSLRSTHSRSSSFSTVSSASGASLSSVETDSTCSMSPIDSPRYGRRSPVFVDASKKEVTQYDGGKTNVLTGGVMLGAPARKSSPVRPSLPTSWRAGRW